ncbi:MAG: hypothetical protein M1832_005997 [Thelocarpon impressellum]|nr:MAG: hypothetical protein M1832_005997 [Thelocarpon impressellum]
MRIVLSGPRPSDFSYTTSTLDRAITLVGGLAVGMRLSGLQRDVLSLYRQCLRQAQKKPNSVRSHFRDFARGEFRRHAGVDKKDFAAIEYLLRKGQRQLDILSAPGITNVMV